MVDRKKEISVVNRSDSLIGYTIPDLGDRHNVRRQFSPREQKIVTFEELEALSWIPGGKTILRDYLVIKDKEALDQLLPNTEAEYFYTKEDVIKLIQTGSYNQFLDCLDFAPEGVIEMVKDLSVSLPMKDIDKIKAMQDKLGYDVLKAIEIEEYRTSKDDNNSEDAAAAPIERKTSSTGRRAAPINDASSHNYKVVE